MKKSMNSISICLLALIATCSAAVITFDDLIGGTSYVFDGGADGLVEFTTVDPAGFSVVGPGPVMNYIMEPGVEGTADLEVDLRVDFMEGAMSSVQFAFALNTSLETHGATFELYDIGDSLIASTYQLAAFTYNPVASTFPEAVLSLDFAGTAAYGLFKFDAASDSVDPRFIVDNFSYSIPEPASVGLLGLISGGIYFTRRFFIA